MASKLRKCDLVTAKLQLGTGYALQNAAKPLPERDFVTARAGCALLERSKLLPERAAPYRTRQAAART
ncbi:hypothetical protein [Shewanella sp.]|uniref:hypothetical protein n=1 Tax=Shewanella sp. TaxID=50422 RepID=UPI001EC28C86|nr:hypothetical protein [Shewanella sp.]NRB24365.1 hypothetical protein [Shewanella sp.]